MPLESEISALPLEPSEVYAGRHSQTMEISLLLASQNIDHQITVEHNLYKILVDGALEDSTKALIDLYQKENKGWLSQLAPDMDLGIKLSPILFLLPMTIGYFFQHGSWFSHWHLTLFGRADSGKIMAGEWWRTVTPLTLHSGSEHYFSNLVSGFFLINLLMHRVSFGYTYFLLFLSGALANFSVALVSGPGHRSIGFSTAVFAALGLLAAAQLKANLHSGTWDKRSFLPLFGSVLLLALVGMGENTDIKAHCLGLVWGLIVGFGLQNLERYFKQPLIQWIFVGSTLGILAASWGLALNLI